MKNQTSNLPNFGILFVLIFSLSITALGCGQSSKKETNNNTSALHMKLFNVNDPQMGISAFRVLAPSGYLLKGGLTWNNNIANLVTADVSITAPDNSVGFYIHPAPYYISGNIESQWAQGQLYLGMKVISMPNSPAEFIQKILIPQQRPSAQNVKLISEKELSNWANGIALVNAQNGANIQGHGVCARFSYTENGKNWEEDFYCVILINIPQMGVQNYTWMAERNLSVRAEAGKLDSFEALAKTFVNSFRVEKRWLNHYVQIQQQWIAAQQRGIRSAGVLSDIISKTNDDFNQGFMQSWNSRQQAEDRAAREFSEYIRGSENYSDPVNDLNVELPGGYDQVWTNVQGEYILSDEPGFDPNRNSNIEWQQIHKLR